MEEAYRYTSEVKKSDCYYLMILSSTVHCYGTRRQILHHFLKALTHLRTFKILEEITTDYTKFNIEIFSLY